MNYLVYNFKKLKESNSTAYEFELRQQYIKIDVTCRMHFKKGEKEFLKHLQSLLQVLKCQPGAGSRDQYNPHQGASDYKETTIGTQQRNKISLQYKYEKKKKKKKKRG